MRKFILFLPLAILHHSAAAQFLYVSPAPGSGYHAVDRSIILKTENPIEPESLNAPDWYQVTGSSSGNHRMQFKLVGDHKTLLLIPEQSFKKGEVVSVVIDSMLRTTSGERLKRFSFSFQVQPPYSPAQKQQLEIAKQKIIEADFGNVRSIPQSVRDAEEFPRFVIDVNTNPAPGDIFYYSFNFDGEPNKYICIMSSDGDSVYAQKNSGKGSTFDINKNGYLTVYNYDSSYFEVWDSSYRLIDTYRTKGYTTDAHDFVLLPNGHSFLMAYDPQIVDMTVFNPNYKSDAVVTGAIIQELDADKNLVFEWRSWDHIEITEAQHIYLWINYIDYIHPNSIEVDNDDNLLISCRVLEQVLKISRTTGEVMWRLGGQKNEFEFLNDPQMFSYQHDCRRLPNGHITLFDNGCYHVPAVASFKEYELDEIAKTARLIFSYKHPLINGKNLESWAMGNAQRLPNGNTFINWGYIPPDSGFPNMTEIDSLGNIVWEMHFADSNFTLAYRAHRYVWEPCKPTEIDSISAHVISESAAIISWAPVRDAGSYLVQYQEAESASWDSLFFPADTTFLILKNLMPATSYKWQIQALCHAKGSVSASTTEQYFTTMPVLPDTGLVQIEVFPNPAHDQLYCIVNQSGLADVQITLKDMAGRVYYKNHFKEIAGDQPFIIPVSDFSAGNYLLKVNTTLSEKVVKVILN